MPSSQGVTSFTESVLHARSSDADQVEAQYRMELFSYRTPGAEQLSAMCSKLLALTVTHLLYHRWLRHACDQYVLRC